MAGKDKILLALRNDEEIKSFTTYLYSLGYETVAVKDGARALEAAIAESPAILIADTDLPVINGDRLFQILRNNPHTSKIPFLFISDVIVDIKGFRSGVDIFLIRPLNMEELHGRIRHTLAVKDSGGFASGEIEGRLRQMSLADILQFLHLNKKEGVLKISSADMTGNVFIKEGQIYNAVSGNVEKEKALFRLLQWTEGKFEFIPSPIAVTKKISTSTGNILMEGMRQIDEFRKSQDQFPNKKMLLRARIEDAALPQGLQPIIYEIIELLKTYQKVEDLVENATYTDYEVYKTIAGMISKGILEEARAKGESHSDTVEFLTNDQAISIREKIISRFSEAHNVSSGKVFLIASSGGLISAFVEHCRRIPGFSVSYKSSYVPNAKENPLGIVATLKLYGGMEINIFSIPSVKNMGPMWKSFSTNLIGLILLWNEEGGKDIKEMVAAKQDILLQRRIPVVHVFADTGGEDTTGGRQTFNLRYKKAFNLKLDEPIFRMDAEMVFEVFYSLFSTLIKEDYVSA
ncbi:MAG: response regulator [Deltaproteobacteria bacterium]|nr:response regulator [Deltaproteobacteria bacterium]